MNTRFNVFFRFLLFLVLFAGVFRPQANVYALTTLTVSPITWNVIGLDSNNVNVGPNYFPVGARVCNTGSEAATNVTATFVWEDGLNLYTGDPYINLRLGTLSTINLGALNPGSCTTNYLDAYFEVQVTRNSSAYDKTRAYHIDVTAGNVAGTISTPTPRELYVEHLVSQSRNAVTNVLLDGVSIPAGGTMNLMVGNSYTISLVGFTATQGYEQLESFINIPNTIFQINSVTFSHSANAGTDPLASTKLYANGCNWENDPNSPNYRSCLGVGKYGGNITVNYDVTILQVPGAPLVNPQPLSTLIYDFSGSSYHYNADFGVSTRYANIINASLTKSFSPKTILPGGTATLTFTITNPGTSAISSLSFTDDLPNNVTLANTSIAYSGCGVSPSPSTASDPLLFTNITVSGSSACTISVTVTSSANGTHNNTTSNLLIGTTDTGSSGSDTLIVNSQPSPPSSCTTPVIFATWSMPTSGQGSGGPPPAYTTKAFNVATATASSSGGTFTIVADGSTAVNSWSGTGWPASGTAGPATTPYFEFVLDTSNYGGVTISFDYLLTGNGDWASASNNFIYVHSQADSGAFSSSTAFSTSKGSWQTATVSTYGITYAAPATGAGTTTFRINAVGAQNTSAEVRIDDVTFTGCARPTVPNLSKSFSPNTISTGSSSALTFTLTNPNTTALPGVSFTDVLPTGLLIATPNGLTQSCSTGTFTGSAVTATAGTSTIAVGGGTLSANAICTMSVNILGNAAGLYSNVSSSISSTDTGPNLTSSGIGTSSLTVVDPPVINKAFTANPIFTGTSTVLTFTIRNPNTSTALTGVQLFPAATGDNLPSGLIVANPNGLTSITCTAGILTGATIGAVAGSSNITMTGGTLSAGANCYFSVNVTGTTTGLKTNSVTVNSTNGGAGNTSTASVLVKDPAPAISLLKSVGPSNTGPWTPTLTVTLPGSVFYRFLVENTGDVALNAVDINDPNVSTASCAWVDGDGTALVAPFNLPVADADDNQLAVCVLGPIAALDGSNPNTATADDNNPGTPTAVSEPSTATYTGIAPNLGLAKTNGVTTVTAGDTTTYTLTVTNSGTLATSGTITIVDVLPTGLSIDDGPVALGGAQAANWSCTAANNVMTCTSSTTIEASGGTDTSVFSFIVNVDATASGTLLNKAQLGGGGDPTNSAAPTGTTAGQCTGTDTPNEGCATDIDTVNFVNLGLAKTNGTTSVTAGGTTTHTLTVTNSGNIATTAPITILDVLPTGLSIPDGAITEGGANAADWTCTAASNGITCTSSAAIAGSNGTSVFSFTVNVDASASGTVTNKAQVGGGGDPTNLNTPTSTTVGQCTDTNSPNEGCSTDTDTVTRSADLSITKTDSVTSINAGATTSYTILVTNNGPSAANGAFLIDPVVAGLSVTSVTCGSATGGAACGATTVAAMQGPGVIIPTLPSGGSVTFTVTATVTATSGNVTNTATIDPPAGTTDPNTNDNIASDTDTVNPVADLAITKTNGVTSLNAGSTTAYTIRVTNNGPSNVSLATLSDPAATGLNKTNVACAATPGQCLSPPTVAELESGTFILPDLASGAFYEIIVTADVTLTSFNSSVTNTATATPPAGTIDPTPGNNTASDTDPVNAVVDMAVTKTDGVTSVSAGGTTTYTIRATNNGPSDVSLVILGDPAAAGLTKTSIACSPTPGLCATPPSIAELESNTFTLPDMVIGQFYEITVMADVTATSGSVTNTANVYVLAPAFIDPNTNNNTASDTDIVNNPSFTIAKDADVFDVDAAGDIITYTVTLTNTGDVTLTGVSVNDPLLANLDCDGVAGAPFTTSGLMIAVSENLPCTGTYTVTQNDIDTNGGGDGLINNTVTGDTNETGQQMASEIVEIIQAPSMVLTKTPALDDTVVPPSGVVNPGDTVTYTFSVQNTGNVTITSINVTDALLPTLSCSIASLAPGASASCTATNNVYTLTQADLNTGSRANTATAIGKDPNNNDVTDPDTKRVTLPQNPALTIDKVLSNNADEDGSTTVSLNDTLTYILTVTNTGNITLTNVVVSDTLITPNTTTCGSLAPNATCLLTGTHVVTQSDVDNGQINNTGSVTDTNVCPAAGTAVCEDPNIQNVPQTPAIQLLKTGSLNDDDGTPGLSAGDTIRYAFTVTNTGNVTLINITLADTIGGLTISGGPVASLAPGASDTTTFTGSYTLTQGDIDAGTFTNTATVTGTPPTGPNVSDPDGDTQTLTGTPSIVLTKSANPTSVTSAGDVIAYTFSVQNTGNVTLTNVTVSDTLLSGLNCTTIATLTPGATQFVACTGNTYTVMQSDIDNNGGGDGDLDNTATAAGTAPGGGTVIDSDSQAVTIPTQNPNLALIKTGALNDNDGTPGISAGDTISYSFTVTNSGNVTLTNVTVADTIGGVTITGGPIVTLLPGASDSTTFTGTYTITAADINRGTFTNTATATGTPPSGPAVSDSDDDTQNLSVTPSILLTKAPTLDMNVAAPPGVANAGDTITYTFSVQNTGNVTITNINVTDPLLPSLTCTIVSLAPGATSACPATNNVYTLTQADVDAGSRANTATATGQDPGNNPVTDPEMQTTFLAQSPSLNIVKEVSTDNLTWNDVSVSVTTGDTVFYRIRVANTGNITLTSLIVDDGMLACTLVRSADIAGDNDADFEVGEEWAYVCSVTAVAGTNNNTATADTTETAQDSDSASYTASAALVADPALSKAGSPTQAAVGETVTFTLTVTNAGTAPANNVVITDPLPAMFDVVTVTSVDQAGGNAGTISVSPAPAPYTVTVTLAALNVTDVVTITITTTVNSLGNPPINNTAGLATTGSNSVQSNDSDTVVITLRSSAVSGSNRAATLPATGFAPDVETKLPAQPQDILYAATDVILEIPSLGVKLPIVGVPKKNGTWDVSWLGTQAGWLEGSAFPSWNGNSVLTSHIYASNGLPGPFVNLSKLKYGDQILVHAYGQKYMFEVQTNEVVLPNNPSAFQHEEKPWLTLITCKEYDAKSNIYRKRVVVRAVLVRVMWDR